MGIKQDFIAKSEEIRKLIKQKDLEAVAKEYTALRGMYGEIVKSDIDVKDKKSMYKKTAELYAAIQAASQKMEKKAKISAGQTATKETKATTTKLGVKDHVLLSEAISDIDREVEKVSQEKQKLEREIAGVVRSIAAVQNDERKLRDEISKLVDKEAVLNSKRLAVKERINKCQEKIAEMLKIKEELRTI